MITDALAAETPTPEIWAALVVGLALVAAGVVGYFFTAAEQPQLAMCTLLALVVIGGVFFVAGLQLAGIIPIPESASLGSTSVDAPTHAHIPIAALSDRDPQAPVEG